MDSLSNMIGAYGKSLEKEVDPSLFNNAIYFEPGELARSRVSLENNARLHMNERGSNEQYLINLPLLQHFKDIASAILFVSISKLIHARYFLRKKNS